MTSNINEHTILFISPIALITIIEYKTSNPMVYDPVFKLISTLKK